MDETSESVLNEASFKIVEKEEITTISDTTTVECTNPENQNGGDAVEMSDDVDVDIQKPDEVVVVNYATTSNAGTAAEKPTSDEVNASCSRVSKTSVINNDEPIKPNHQNEESDDDKFLLRLTFKNSETFAELHNVISTCIRDALFQLKKSTVISIEKQTQTVNFMTVAGIEEDIFMIDTLPTDGTNNTEIPDYKSGFEKVLNDEREVEADKSINDDKPKGNCWNCGGDHNLRECKEPRDMNQINKSKQAFMKGKDRAERYHLDVDQKFGHFVPGQISDDLKQALGLKKRELPLYIYRMRCFGYPPGWLEDAKVSHSGLSLFNSENKAAPAPDVEDGEVDKITYDPSKFISYPGFNAQFPEGTIDDSHYYEAPPMQYYHSKDGLIEALRGNLLKTYKRKKLKHITEAAVDVDLNEDDMDIDNDEDNDSPVLFPQSRPEPNEPESPTNIDASMPNDSDEQIELISETESKAIVPEDSEISDSYTLSLTELQQRKLELLRALADSSEIDAENTNSPAVDSPADAGIVLDTAVEPEVTIKSDEPVTTEATQPDVSTPKDENTSVDVDIQKPYEVVVVNYATTSNAGTAAEKPTSDEVNASCSEKTDDSDTDNSEIETPTTPVGTGIGRSRIAVSGTPLLKQVSPFSGLPSSEKWSVGVSDVIDFENLPDATGTYRRLSGLIQKVRTVVKKINDENDAEDDNENS